ncbi:MAG: nucleotidyltransferase domain-containing protein [Candidatus Woesearchaeota archaeon]
MTSERQKIMQGLKSEAKKFCKKNTSIADIAVYGSFSRGKLDAGDIDLAILLKQKEKLEKKLSLAQELRHLLSKKMGQDFDVKCLDFIDLTSKDFLAREGIISEGFLLIKNKQIAELFGFNSRAIFTYSLNNLSLSQKTTLRYILGGRRGSKGLLKERNGEQLGKGAISIPINHSDEFRELFDKYKVRYKARNAMIE